MEEAVASAAEDGDWDREIEIEKANDILITVKFQDKKIPVAAELKPQPKASNTKAVSYDGLPAIATKNVRPQDVYNVSVRTADDMHHV